MYIHVCTYLCFSIIVYTMSVSRCTLALYIHCTYMVQTCLYTFMPGGQDSRCPAPQFWNNNVNISCIYQYIPVPSGFLPTYDVVRQTYDRRTTLYNTDVAYDVVRQARTTSKDITWKIQKVAQKDITWKIQMMAQKDIMENPDGGTERYHMESPDDSPQKRNKRKQKTEAEE